MKTILFLMFFSISGFAIDAKDNYSVKIDVMMKGNYKIYQYEINQRKIQLTQFLLEKNAKKILFEQKMTSQQFTVLKALLDPFPIEIVKEIYHNKDVKGSIHREYTLCINGKTKKIKTYYLSDKNLNLLTEKINDFFPEKYRLNLEKTQ